MAKRLFLNDKVILIFILLNSVIIFISGFELTKTNGILLTIIDNIITGLFIVEIMVKLREYGVKMYFSSNWNKFDFLLVIFSIPAFISFILNIEMTSIGFLLVFRVMRVFKSFRFLKFIPGIDHLIEGTQRALKASIVVLIGFITYIFITGIFSFYLFKSNAPQYFGNPLTSLYSIFKIFTVDGWNEIPEQLIQELSPLAAFFTYFYFIFILLTGGIFGLSLVNSIFVDAMINNNNDELEQKINSLDEKITKLLIQHNKHDGIPK